MKWFGRNGKKLTFLFLLFECLPRVCLSQEASNFQFIVSLTDSLLNSALSEVSVEQAGQVGIKSLENDNKLNWFFEDRLVELLRRRGVVSIYLNNESPINSPILIFEYNALEIDFKYDKPNSALQDSLKVKRIADVGFFITITDQATGDVLLSKRFEATKIGWFQLNRSGEQTNDNIHFFQGSSKSSKKNIIQPILITSVTGIIVYLFYALRSR